MEAITLRVDDDLELQLVSHRHAGELFALVEQSRPALRRWLPWVDLVTTLDEEIRYVEYYRARFIRERALTAAVVHGGRVGGIVSLNYVDWKRRCTALGYWLGNDFHGKGLMTRCCAAMIEYSFDTLGLHRVQIFCAVENHASRRIPERLGFSQEGCLRDGEWLNGGYVDSVAYGLTKSCLLPGRK